MLLSIVIPTRNRQSVARATVAAIGRIADRDFEVVVQDGSDDDRLGEWLSTDGDARVSYQYGGPSRSMAENWNRAMPRARGTYVLFIGDDDSVDEHIMPFVRWTARRDLVAACSSHSKYFWADIPDSALARRLHVQNEVTGIAHTIDARADIIDRLRRADLATIYLLPKVYHGIVRRDLIEALHARSGLYFAGSAPDWYSSWALAPSIRRLGFVDYPFTIMGVCRDSNTGRSVDPHRRRAYLTEYASAGHPSSTVKTSRPGLLQHKFDAIYQGLSASGEARLLDEFNYPRFYAAAILDEPSQTSELLRQLWRHYGQDSPGRRATELAGFGGHLTTLAARRAWVSLSARSRRLPPPSPPSPRVLPISTHFRWNSIGLASTIAEAMDLQTEVMRGQGALERMREAIA